MKRPYFASWNHSRRFALAASCPSTPVSTASRPRPSLRAGLAPLGPLCSRQASTAAIGRRILESERITGDLAGGVGDKERYVAALWYHDANRHVGELVGVDLVEFAA